MKQQQGRETTASDRYLHTFKTSRIEPERKTSPLGVGKNGAEALHKNGEAEEEELCNGERIVMAI